MLVVLASMVLARQGNPYIDPNLPRDEQALMSSVMSGYPGDPGTVCYIDEHGTAHTNKVGGLSGLVRWQPVKGQPGVYTDGAENFAGPTTDQVPPTSIATDDSEDMDDLFGEGILAQNDPNGADGTWPKMPVVDPSTTTGSDSISVDAR